MQSRKESRAPPPVSAAFSATPMSSFDTVLLLQVAVALVVVPLLVSALLYFLWPNVWTFVAEKLRCAWSVLTCPCAAVYTHCCRKEESLKKSRHDPHYIGPEHRPSEDPLRQSKTKAERKLRVENPKRREKAAADERLSLDEHSHSSRKAQATRVEKSHRAPAPMVKAMSVQSGFKYQFQEKSVTEEVNPYLSSGSTPPGMESFVMEIGKDTSGDLESGTTEEERGEA